MRFVLKGLFGLGLMFAALSSPLLAQESDYPRTITDSLGAETVINSADRIFVVHQITSSLVSALGAYDRVVGRTRFVDDPKEDVESVPEIGTYSELEAEGILSVEPDLVLIVDRHLGLSGGNLSVVEQLREAGVAVLVLPQDGLLARHGGVYELDIMQEFVQLTADALALDERGAEIVARMESEAEEASQIAAGSEPSRVLALGAFSVGGKMFAQGPGSPYDLVIRMAGAQNVAAELGPEAFHELTPEGLVALEPDVIVVGERIFNELSDTDPMSVFLSLPGVADTPAAQNEAFYLAPVTVVYGSTPHLAAAALDLAKVLYPDGEGN
ncbi:ABC transporter substrate-binding protein [Pelagibacterium luteolum]|uniref:Iron complex transport system substrate-binding protein n=1 Tax=Pelagibacterium luteolum TaxID=440168 RepID=A0A1G7YJH5_9HYPH|nr:ABC transporter substrate-binding protein [Pelagibacterium luteolum]SDG96691.1 iron complex transport system substrate-binding protein [Pelagibacterium luteolum]